MTAGSRVRLAGAVALALAAGAITACGASTHKQTTGSLLRGAAPVSCSQAIAKAPALASVHTAMVALRGRPFGVATTRDGRWSFVAVLPGRLDVLSDSSFAPHLVRTVALPIPGLGVALTHDGRELLVANDLSGTMVLSVARLESGSPNPVLGILEAPGSTRAFGAIEATTSLDDRFAFVSVEYGSEVTVYNLGAALADRFARPAYVGAIPLGDAVVGQALSPDGRDLYVTSEVAAGRRLGSDGTLSVIDVASAERDPAKSVVATLDAGCQPVRVALSPDGRTVWVTARASDELLGFSAARLRSDPKHALVAAVRVGEAPVGLAVLDGGAVVAVADSDRFNAPSQHAELTFVDTRAALANRPAVLGTAAAGSFPREMALEPNGRTLLVDNFASAQLEAVDVAALTRATS
jgi:DNA-binding beta-propeller fold protein YncE